MRILIISEPKSSLANSLLKSSDYSLISVTPENVHLCTGPEAIISGKKIDCPQHIEMDIVKIKEKLLAAYPLIDRWVSRRQSISVSIGIMLEYTISLIKIIGNYPPKFAVVETGAPHHLFTYCLDVALNYLGIKIYYLYGNAFDGRCLVVEGIEKKTVVRVSDYSAGNIINGYIKKIKDSALYIPEDSTRSISPFLHKSAVYATFMYFKYSMSRFIRNLCDGKKSSISLQIKLKLQFLKLSEVISIFNAHKEYQKMLTSQGEFQVSKITPDDIVYVGHMLPEATSCPDSLYYPDEVDVLLDLKNRFPNSKIYYREHPAIGIFSEFGHIHMQGLHKNTHFYYQLESLGIAIVPPSIHISKIRERGCLFATKTGRVAAENSVLGIPTIIYGYPFYGIYMPLTFHISKLPLQSTVKDIKALALSVKDSEVAIQKYLITMFSGSIENPGIGLELNVCSRSVYESNFIQLIKYISSKNDSLN
jgi:hypothetical protein